MKTTQSRMTRQRRIILEELSKTCSHPTVDEIYTMVKEKLPNISLGTVYRNLDLLAENNQIIKLETAGSIRRYDANLHPHSHIRCISCGQVYDIPHIDTAQLDLNEEHIHGFSCLQVRVEIDGLCPPCSNKKQ